MTGLTQEEQKRNSPFTLEAILEEEPDVNNKRMLEIQHQDNKNKKEILKKIKKIDKELNLERVFPVGYKDIEIISFEITGNDITGKKSLGIYYSAAIEDSYGVFDSIYSYATIDLDIFLLRDTEIEVLAKEADQKKKLEDMLKAREKYEELSKEIERKERSLEIDKKKKQELEEKLFGKDEK